MNTSVESVSKELFGYLLGFQASWIGSIGLRTGLFEAIQQIGKPGVTAEKLAEKLSLDPRFVGVWCRGAYAFHYLKWEEENGFSLSAEMGEVLLNELHPLYMGRRLQTYTASYEDFLIFPELMQSGGVWPRSEHDPFLLESIYASTQRDGVMITDHVMPGIPGIISTLENGGKLLEVGAGGGQHTVHYARRFPAAEIFAIEYDETSLELARERIEKEGFGTRVTLQQGDANELSFHDQFDVVTMNLVLHETGGPKAYHNVMQRVYQALTPGGYLIVSELPYPDDIEEYQSNPVYQKLAGLQFHETVVGCGMITMGELKTYFDETDFINVHAIEQPNPGRYVVVGEKPQKDN